MRSRIMTQGNNFFLIRFLGWAALLWGGMAFLSPREALAHTRHYVFNQEYQTLPQGVFELESHTGFEVPDHHLTNDNEIEYQEELEYGVTDHLSVAHYENWKTENHADPEEDDATRYRGFKFETKYRFAEKGKYWVDPLFYLEWATDPQNRDNPNTLEGKIVLSKDLGKFNVTYNQVLESELGKGGHTTHEYTAGVNYEIFSDVHLAGEIKGTYWTPRTHRNEIAMGPTLSYEAKYFWIAVGHLFGVNHAAKDHETQIIIGVPFG